MNKNIARGGATRIEAWDGEWDSGFAVAGADGTIVGRATGDSGADRTVSVNSGQMLPILWSTISSAPAGTVVVW